MTIEYGHVGKWIKSGLTIAAIVVAWMQGEHGVELNWGAISAFFSGGVLLTLLVMAVQLGTWKGTVDQRFRDLKDKVDEIDQRGCGAATRLHRKDQ